MNAGDALACRLPAVEIRDAVRLTSFQQPRRIHQRLLENLSKTEKLVAPAKKGSKAALKSTRRGGPDRCREPGFRRTRTAVSHLRKDRKENSPNSG